MIGKRSIVVHFVTALCYFVISRWIIRSIFYFSKVKYYPLSVSFWIPGVEWQMLNVTPQWDGASSVKCILNWYFVQIRFCPSQCVTAALSLSDTLELQAALCLNTGFQILNNKGALFSGESSKQYIVLHYSCQQWISSTYTAVLSCW